MENIDLKEPPEDVKMTTELEVVAVPEDILEETNAQMEWLRQTIESLPIPPTSRAKAAVACFVVVLEHHDSILLLSEHQLYASSFALVRIAFDAYIRGVWLSICASDPEVERFISLKEPPKTSELVREIEKHPFFEDGFLSSYKIQAYKWMCDFTHTGGRQIQRWTAEEGLEPNYPLGEVLEVIAISQSIALLALLGGIAIAESGDVTEEALRQFELVRMRTVALHDEQRFTYP